jgi:CheY-like chemotaxis protein
VAEGPILIIDDDLSILETVSDILEFEGYPVARAMNGAEGLDMLEEVQPSLVLLDMRMPVLDGWEFARALQSRGIRLPILVMTAAQDARRWAQEIGADAYIAKPFDMTELLSTVERLRAA